MADGEGIKIKSFLDENFLLDNKTAEILYHEYAKKQPIIDYHNHLSPKAIARDANFENITEAWLNGDHYKWRAMRNVGVAEKFITGEASDAAKFQRWAETVPQTIRNPLFHWTHLELQRYFNISKLLNGENAEHVFKHTSEYLSSADYSSRNLLRRMNVEVVCTTDDPTDKLEFHKAFKIEGGPFKMLPTFRPDKAIDIRSVNFTEYIRALGLAADIEIKSFADLQDALMKRLDYFHLHGCRLADYGLTQVHSENFTEGEVNAILGRRLAGFDISGLEAKKFMSAVLFFLGCQYAERSWVQQFHLGATRNNNARMMKVLGADTGFDSMGENLKIGSLAGLLSRLDEEKQLAKTIIYNLNPADNEMLATMLGNFNDGSVRGKMQFGSAWWFLDQKDGMEKQINALSNMGLLSCFVGMLTDSRSFLSFPRHEYFRRILCNLIGRDVHNGELPNDSKWLGGIVNDICYHNAKTYFDF